MDDVIITERKLFPFNGNGTYCLRSLLLILCDMNNLKYFLFVLLCPLLLPAQTYRDFYSFDMCTGQYMYWHHFYLLPHKVDTVQVSGGENLSFGMKQNHLMVCIYFYVHVWNKRYCFQMVQKRTAKWQSVTKISFYLRPLCRLSCMIKAKRCWNVTRLRFVLI